MAMSTISSIDDLSIVRLYECRSPCVVISGTLPSTIPHIIRTPSREIISFCLVIRAGFGHGKERAPPPCPHWQQPSIHHASLHWHYTRLDRRAGRHTDGGHHQPESGGRAAPGSAADWRLRRLRSVDRQPDGQDWPAEGDHVGQNCCGKCRVIQRDGAGEHNLKIFSDLEFQI